MMHRGFDQAIETGQCTDSLIRLGGPAFNNHLPLNSEMMKQLKLGYVKK